MCFGSNSTSTSSSSPSSSSSSMSKTMTTTSTSPNEGGTTDSIDDTNNNNNKNKNKNKQMTMISSSSSGFQRHRHQIEFGFILLASAYGILCRFDFPIDINPIHCSGTTTTTCKRPDLVAYKIISFFAMVIMGTIGIYHWHFASKMKQLAPTTTSKRSTNDKTGTPEERLFGALDAANQLNVIIFCYQLWDFCISFAIPEHMDMVFLIHHLLATLTAYCSLEYQMVSYYSIFYGGCSEVSSIFLVLIDTRGTFPVIPGSIYEQFKMICQLLFFLTFSYYRIYGWIRYSIPLWKDCYHVITTTKSIEEYRPGKTYFLRLFQALDVLLGGLQCFWYTKILQSIFFPKK